MTRALFPRGFSDEAQYIESTISDDRHFLHKSCAFGIERVMRDELASVWEECKEANWDGFQALPVTPKTLLNTYLCLESLPLGYPQPSISAEPDGELTLEWHRSARRTVLVQRELESKVTRLTHGLPRFGLRFLEAWGECSELWRGCQAEATPPPA